MQDGSGEGAAGGATGVFSTVVRRILQDGPTDSGSRRIIRLEDIHLLRDQVLVKVLRARGLNRLPPKYLGFIDFDEWTEDALLALACEAFGFAVLQRLDSLNAQIAIQPGGNIDPLIRRNVGNFLTDLQSTHDEVGHRVYQNIRIAATKAVQTGWLLNPDSSKPDEFSANSKSVLRWPNNKSNQNMGVEDIRALVELTEAWRQCLVDLSKTRKVGHEAGARALRWICSSAAKSVMVSSVAAALAPLSRAEVQAANTDADSEVAVEDTEFGGLSFIRAVSPPPLSPFIEWRDFVESVRSRIEKTPATPRKGRLSKIFDAVVGHVENHTIDEIDQRSLATALGFPKSTLNDDLRHLKRVISAVRSDSE